MTGSDVAFQKSSLSLMLYLADNLAYIPFTVVDEPLYVIHQIDIMISVAGSNLLQTFKEVRTTSGRTGRTLSESLNIVELWRVCQWLLATPESFQALRPPPSAEQRLCLDSGKVDYIYDEDLDDDFDSVSSRLPDDCRPLQEAITASQGCMLLLVLKEHLKDNYGITAA